MKWSLPLIIALFVFGCGSRPEPQDIRSTDQLLIPSIQSCLGKEPAFRVISRSENDSQFRQRVGDLVSVSLNPAALGDVSGALVGETGVELKMTLAFDSSDQIVNNLSKFKMTIRDSLIGAMGSDGNIIAAFQIIHGGDSQLSGAYDPKKKVLHLQYSDSYGRIFVDGQVQADQLSGQIGFKNSVSWDGSKPRGGILGQFQGVTLSCSAQRLD